MGVARKQVAPDMAPASLPGKRIPVPIKKSEEHWSQYTLSDGTVIRVRPILIDVNRVDGQYNQAGEPVYELKSGGVMDVKVPERLRKRKS